MTTSVRTLTEAALRALKALSPGDIPVLDELTAVLTEVQELLYGWHARRGPMKDVDVSADYTAGANERVRVQDGATITVTLPNSIRITDGAGSTASADANQTSVYDFGRGSAGGTYRQPRDGERIEVVGQSQGLWFYVSDTNAWVNAQAIALDDPLPFPASQISDWAALLAERMIDSWPGLYEPTPSLQARIARARAAIYLRPGVNTDPTQGEYL